MKSRYEIVIGLYRSSGIWRVSCNYYHVGDLPDLNGVRDLLIRHAADLVTVPQVRWKWS